MGTKAVFAVSAGNGRYFTRIVGMTMDGSQANLLYLAQEFVKLASKAKLLDGVRACKGSVVVKVLQLLVEQHPDWLFLDESRNAQWVSNSCIVDVAASTVELYDGKFEDLASTVELHVLPGPQSSVAPPQVAVPVTDKNALNCLN